MAKTKRLLSIKERLLAKLLLPFINPRCDCFTGWIFSELMESQWFSRQSLDEVQALKLSMLLKTAFDQIPYYRKYGSCMQAEFKLAQSRLAQLPILTKDEVRQAGKNLRCSAGMQRRVVRATTGGTTGEPIEVWKSVASVSMSEAAVWRGKAWAGIGPWSKAVVVHGFGGGSWYGRLRMRLLRRWPVEAFRTKSADRQKTREIISRVRPVVLEGFVSDLLGIAEEQYLEHCGVKVVLTTGEMLYDFQRTVLENAFKARVSEYYGSNEVNSIAFECELGAKHVTDEHVIIETVDDKGHPVWDEPGRILVTELDNMFMPLIRYELGDIGVLSTEPCQCGRKLLVLKSLSGRQQDVLQNAEGDRLSATFFAGRFKELRAIRRLQLVQYGLNNIEIRYEGDVNRATEEIEAIKREIHGRLGLKMSICSSHVTEIERTPAGKRLLVVGLRQGR